MGITFGDLKRQACVKQPLKYKKYEHQGFRTPSRKIELYSSIFEKYGYDPLPHYIEPPESPVRTPHLVNEYPLILITGGRHIVYFHTEGRQIPWLREINPNPEIEIRPDTAERLGVKEEDWVWVETPKVKGERIKLKARLTCTLHPKVVRARHHWWFPEKPPPEHGCFESNVNVLFDWGPPWDPVFGSVPTRGTLCKVYKA